MMGWFDRFKKASAGTPSAESTPQSFPGAIASSKAPDRNSDCVAGPVAELVEPEGMAEPVADLVKPECVAGLPVSPAVSSVKLDGNPPRLEPQAAPIDAPASAAEHKGFWRRTWEVLNAPIPGTPSFKMDDQSLSQIAERLESTRRVMVDRVKTLVRGRARIDEELLEELEELLLESDLGVKATLGALSYLREQVRTRQLQPDQVTDALASYLRSRLGAPQPLAFDKGHLQVVMVVGVNGTGKTTTLGKLARRLKIEGFDVVLAAADTFRAAAIDQLEVWAERAQVQLIRHAEGGDAAAVVFDAIAAAKARQADIILIDTAGRLHNKANLMAELQKIRRTIDRQLPEASLEALLVLDATTGQNGLRQAEVFGSAVSLTGCILTKLDGTAKGGVIFGIHEELGLPVKLVGLGEGIEDLRDFDPGVFVEALFSVSESEA